MGGVVICRGKNDNWNLLILKYMLQGLSKIWRKTGWMFSWYKCRFSTKVRWYEIVDLLFTSVNVYTKYFPVSHSLESFKILDRAWMLIYRGTWTYYHRKIFLLMMNVKIWSDEKVVKNRPMEQTDISIKTF